MAAALRVVAGALAAGPAGVVWAFRKSQQEGESAPNSTLASLAPQVPSGGLTAAAKLSVQLTSVTLSLAVGELLVIVLQLGDEIRSVLEFRPSSSTDHSLHHSQNVSFQIPPFHPPENLLIRIERRGAAGECVAKSFVSIPQALASGPEGHASVTLVSPKTGRPAGVLQVALRMEVGERLEQGQGRMKDAIMTISGDSQLSIAVPEGNA